MQVLDLHAAKIEQQKLKAIGVRNKVILYLASMNVMFTAHAMPVQYQDKPRMSFVPLHTRSFSAPLSCTIVSV